MPQVPTYGGPQVERNRLDPPLQRPVDVSSGLTAVGQGLGNVGAGVEKMALHNADVEANTLDQRITTGWLEWDAENKNKYQGENAEQYGVDARKWWDEAQSKYGGTGSSPMAQAAIGPTLGRKRNQAMAGVLGTVAVRREQHADAAYSAAQAASVTFGVSTENPDGVAGDIRQAAAALGARKGWTTEQVKEEQQRQIGVMHGAFIKKLIAADGADKAQTYYEEAKQRGEIPATAQPDLEKNLTAEVDNQWADKWAISQRGKTYDEQLTAWEGLKESPARQKKALDQLRLNQAHRDAGDRQREKQASDRAWQDSANGQRPPESVLSQMDGHDRANLENWIAARTERLAKGTPVRTDRAVHAGLYDLAREDPETFSKLNLASLSEKLAPADLEQVAALQRNLLDPSKKRETITWTQQTGAAVKGMKPAQAGDFTSAAQAEVVAFATAHNRQPNQSERQKIVNDLLVEGTLARRWWFDETKPTWKMTPEERTRAQYPNATVEGVAPGGSPIVVPGVAPGGGSPGARPVNAQSASGKVTTVSAGAAKWQTQVTKAAGARGLDAGILLAQLDQESGGNPNAVGPKTASGTAKGLTQFTDATAKQYGVNPLDPQSAIDGQAAYMGDLLKKYGGSYEKALAAYNWGPANVDKLVAAQPGDWQAKLPAETRKYITAIATKAGRTPEAPGAATTAAADKFAAGRVYTDANGNRGMYLGNNQWRAL